ncbi:uncharacterized protein [Dermacentor andersoni]|uniref:uncharacterized protein n=1 Tax=Dermacentor andersoni TaxID=34620 RepID=UPI002155A596|nr:uncharacterized protein LOC126517370 [Dermacentor andersoni]
MTKVSPSQDGDGKKPRPPRSRLSAKTAESRLRSWLTEQDLSAGCTSSGAPPKQSPVKRLLRTKRQGGGAEPQPPPATPLSSRGGDTRRPAWISERDWQEAGSSSGARPSPVKRLGPDSRPAKTARMQRRTAAVTATVSGMPRRRRSQEEVSRQSQALARLSLSDLGSEEDDVDVHQGGDDAAGPSGAPMQVDPPAPSFAGAFDETARSAWASAHTTTASSACAATGDPGQQSGDSSSS